MRTRAEFAVKNNPTPSPPLTQPPTTTATATANANVNAIPKREEMLVAALKAKSKPSRAQYRMMATRQMTGGKRVKVQNTSTQAADLEMIRVDGGAKEEKVQNVVNFKASAYRCVLVR